LLQFEDKASAMIKDYKPNTDRSQVLQLNDVTDEELAKIRLKYGKVSALKHLLKAERKTERGTRDEDANDFKEMKDKLNANKTVDGDTK